MKIYFTILLAILSLTVSAQFAYGLTVRTELYNHYTNPKDNIASPHAGSALLNIGIGPKLWIGSDQFTIAPEATIVFSPFAFSASEYKGLGAYSIPLLLKLEFAGLSNFNEMDDFGYGIGAGVQYTRTELFGLTSKYKDQGVNRSLFRTYIVQADFGFGASGFDIHGYLRYGWDPTTKASLWTVGVGYDFNLPRLKKETNSDF